jgi:hypothetical protein
MPSQKRAKAKRREQRGYKEALATQLRFIHRSCQIFDQGHWDEAIRIATQARVILHQGSGKNKSLLQHLGVQGRVKLLSTCQPVSPSVLVYYGMGTFEMSTDENQTTFRFFPGLDDTSFRAEMPLHEWWEQIVWASNEVKLRRKDIILTADNKDGGAHFDDLTPEYEHLATPGAAGSFGITVEGMEHSIPIAGAHFVCLRQIGHEILHSPGLTALLEQAA